MTDVTETVQKPTFGYTLKPALHCQSHGWLYSHSLLHESLDKYIYAVEKAEDQ